MFSGLRLLRASSNALGRQFFAQYQVSPPFNRPSFDRPFILGNKHFSSTSPKNKIINDDSLFLIQKVRAEHKRRYDIKVEEELKRFSKKSFPDGSVEFTLENPMVWFTDYGDFCVVIGYCFGLTHITRQVELHHVPFFILPLLISWVASKSVYIQQESIKAIPSIGLQLTTTHGLTRPWASACAGKKIYYETFSSIKLIPLDMILDIMPKEEIHNMIIDDSLMIASKRPPGFLSSFRGDEMNKVFSNLDYRLPIVQEVYQSIYPVIFGRKAPLSVSLRDDSEDSEDSKVKSQIHTIKR